MSVTISTDIGSQIRWQARKGNDNTLTLSVTNNSVAYDISNFTFSVYIFRWGADYTTTSNAVVSLTQGGGITNGGSSGTLTCVISSSLLSSLLPEQYFIRFKVVHPDTTVHDWINGQFILNSELWDGSSSASGTIAVNLGGSTVSVALNIQVGTVVGPTSVTDGDFALFNGTTGQLIKDAGKGLSYAGAEAIIVAASDETTALTTGTGKVSFRVPFAFSLSSVRANLVTAQTSGSIFTIDVKKNGITLFSTKPTIDNTELSTQTAAAPSVLTTTPTNIADDDLITVDITQVGDGTAKGLKVTLIGTR